MRQLKGVSFMRLLSLALLVVDCDARLLTQPGHSTARHPGPDGRFVMPAAKAE